MKRNAIISGVYRFLLEREWDAGKEKLMWVMLNPSTADAEQDDPTIRRCVSFASDWGFGGILVVNLFAWRATSPKDLMQADREERDIIGGMNTDWWLHASKNTTRIVCAWGAHPLADYNSGYFCHVFDADELWCLGKTKSGAPRHPLYVKSDTTLKRYND